MISVPPIVKFVALGLYFTRSLLKKISFIFHKFYSTKIFFSKFNTTFKVIFHCLFFKKLYFLTIKIFFLPIHSHFLSFKFYFPSEIINFPLFITSGKNLICWTEKSNLKLGHILTLLHLFFRVFNTENVSTFSIFPSKFIKFEFSSNFWIHTFHKCQKFIFVLKNLNIWEHCQLHKLSNFFFHLIYFHTIFVTIWKRSFFSSWPTSREEPERSYWAIPQRGSDCGASEGKNLEEHRKSKCDAFNVKVIENCQNTTLHRRSLKTNINC